MGVLRLWDLLLSPEDGLLPSIIPVISGLGGSSGNQALVAVSLRELALGLMKPYELWWVVVREASVGILNGLALSSVLGCVAFLWKGNPYLGLVLCHTSIFG